MSNSGHIVILNGAPRSGKSSIVRALQAQADDVWLNLGVDISTNHMIPENMRPGIGLRPGGERTDLEPLAVRLYGALYESIAAHAREGFNVAAEFGHHEAHSRPLGIFEECRARLRDLPVLLVGVQCPIEEIMRRRRSGSGTCYAASAEGDPPPEPVLRWQDAVHAAMSYDLEVDTGRMTPEECAAAILARLG